MLFIDIKYTLYFIFLIKKNIFAFEKARLKFKRIVHMSFNYIKLYLKSLKLKKN
jgi:hypothetical protein